MISFNFVPFCTQDINIQYHHNLLSLVNKVLHTRYHHILLNFVHKGRQTNIIGQLNKLINYIA